MVIHYSTFRHSLAHALHLHIHMAQFLLLPLSVPLAPLYTPLSLTWHPPAVTGIVLLRLRLLVNWPCLPHPSPNCPALSNFLEPQLPRAWQRRSWDQSALAMRNNHFCISFQIWTTVSQRSKICKNIKFAIANKFLCTCFVDLISNS